MSAGFMSGTPSGLKGAPALRDAELGGLLEAAASAIPA